MSTEREPGEWCPGELWAIGPVILERVHTADQCAGRPCTLHNPTEHHMASWPLMWLDSRKMLVRLCPCHEWAHPDPDNAPYFHVIGLGHLLIHACHGCCEPPEVGAVPV